VKTIGTVLAPVVLASLAGVGAAQEPATHPVKEIPSAQVRVTTRMIPLGIETNRMRGLTFDPRGNAWIALGESDRRRVIKADPATGKAESVLVTSEPSSDKLYLDYVIPVGEELFICGGWHPRQLLFNPKTGKGRAFEMKKSNPEIYNAVEVDGSVYAFDANNGIHVWNRADWTSELIPWPRPGKGPFAGTYVKSDYSFYCPLWWTQGMAETQPLLRYDLKARKWTTLDPPWPKSKPMLPVEVKGKLYLTDMFNGFMMVFDLASQKFEARHALPGHGKKWQYAATFSVHGPFIDCTLSTFAGVPNEKKVFGFDGRPHHFVNRRLLFDTRDGSAALVAVPSLSGEGYATVAYSQPRGDSLFLTCVDSPMSEGRPREERGAAYLVEMKAERAR
jgi:hypothetical protein